MKKLLESKKSTAKRIKGERIPKACTISVPIARIEYIITHRPWLVREILPVMRKHYLRLSKAVVLHNKDSLNT